jgi:hypothetical protein
VSDTGVPLFGHAGLVRPRSANEWRSFWHQGGERELLDVLREAWTPLRGVSDEMSATQAERVALLLGSSAPVRALAAELGRIRADLGAAPDVEADRDAAGKVSEWFQARSR